MTRAALVFSSVAAATILATTILAAPAQAIPTYPNPCSNCHVAGTGVTLSATLLTATPTQATYRVQVSPAHSLTGWAVFGDAGKIAYGLKSVGQFSVPVAKTYTVFGVNGQLASMVIRPAAPITLESGVSNPVTWGTKSGQWTTIWCRTNLRGAWATVDVVSSKGTVKTVYDAPLSARPSDSASRTTFPPWNGKDTTGHYLPTGNYRYRVRLSRGGLTTITVGPMSVSRSRFTLVGSSVVARRYLFAGGASAYCRTLLPPGRSVGGFSASPDLGIPAVTPSWSSRVASNNVGAGDVWSPTVTKRVFVLKPQFWRFAVYGYELGSATSGARTQVTVIQ